MCNPSNTASRRGRAAAVLVLPGLALLVLAAHGWAVNDGLYYDDHWHRAALRASGWNLHDLTEATTFDFPGRLIHMWWQDTPLQWRYPRPVAMFFMKLEYTLTGGSPAGLHACGLVWHWLTAYLVFRLVRRVLNSAGWGLFAAACFVLNPNAAFAVSWSAARNALVGTFLLLAAVLAYAAASLGRHASPGPPRGAWLFAAVMLWGLALFSREVAVVFPVLAAALDAACGGRGHLRRRLPVYGGLLLVALIYIVWRLHVFPTMTTPRLYFEAPTGPAYLLWTGSKLLQLAFGAVFFLPLFADQEPFARPAAVVALWHAVMLVLLLGEVLLYLWITRGRAARWFWLVWLVAALAPLVPVAAMPHFAYLPFVGLAGAAALLLSSLRRRWQAVLVPVALLVAVGVLVAHRVLWRGAFRAEQLVVAEIAATTPPPLPGSRLFFINLPANSTFTTVALREAWGVSDVEGYVLTLAPETFRMSRPSTVERVGPRELIVSAPPPGYFASYLERAFLRMSRRGAPLEPGLTIPGDVFDTTILAMEGAGVTRLKFSFHVPLDDGRCCFFVSTPERSAARLRFAATESSASDYDRIPELVPLPAGWSDVNGEALAARARLAGADTDRMQDLPLARPLRARRGLLSRQRGVPRMEEPRPDPAL